MTSAACKSPVVQRSTPWGTGAETIGITKNKRLSVPNSSGKYRSMFICRLKELEAFTRDRSF
jgi:hypothetical protein